MQYQRDEVAAAAPEQNAGDYFVLSAESGSWVVSTAMVRAIESALDAWPAPRWIRFVDLSGSRVRVRASTLHYIVQSTPDQRAFDRRMCRALREERKGEEGWEDD